ncbi:MAG: DUF488 domain-containing protein [Deltaproteobacteria bacterium]|nr:DUF488 domain-containing protein [Deltaproteobacteria bacterium]MBW2050088.1 DUF488 domain-containing protein [Deltaproteobacteria bacterium]MBW2110137.1 DUF488 domain-containing protein [Deltaproteobacteria bacterium]HDZ91544.1 DUF488 domain-containing protein [Deltaproteobacteria bacterium]
MAELYTIGHSTHSLDSFIELLSMHGITAVCDVRSAPYSRFNPQFNRETLQEELKKNRIAYVFLGRELGPRSDDPACYVENKVDYNLLSRTGLFQEGLKRVRQGMGAYRIALMCAEKDPIICHRTILVCRHLRARGVRIRHILEDGAIEENDQAIGRLLRILKLPERDLFHSPMEMIEQAYDQQARKIAHRREDGEDLWENGRRR